MKSITPVYLCAFLLVAACGSKDTAQDRVEPKSSGETEISAPDVPVRVETSARSSYEKMSPGELRAALNIVSGETETSDISEMAKALSDKLDIKELRDLSNGFWSGRDDLSRNRRASTALAEVAYEREAQVWSQLRTGIGYISGTGVVKDTDKAVMLLSDSLLEGNSGAAYFLSLAHKEAGNTAAERAALLEAQALGHKNAAKRLAELGN